MTTLFCINPDTVTIIPTPRTPEFMVTIISDIYIYYILNGDTSIRNWEKIAQISFFTAVFTGGVSERLMRVEQEKRKKFYLGPRSDLKDACSGTIIYP